jgi:preprotein translocase subunit SecB
MGWFKVGLSFINPFGKEQSDLPLDSTLDYNLEVSASVSQANDFYFQVYLCDTFKGSDDDRFVFLCNINR